MRQFTSTWPICIMCGRAGLTKDRPLFIEVNGKYRCQTCDNQKNSFELIMKLMNKGLSNGQKRRA